MTVFEIIAIFFSLFLAGFSGVLFLWIRFPKGDALKILLAFSGAFLFGLCVLHIFPEIFSVHNHSIGLFLLLGFVFQVGLDFFSKGIEHGHVHSTSKKIPYLLLLSLAIHSFFEGLPFAESSFGAFQESLLYAILVHKIPISIALAVMLIHSGIKKNIALAVLFFFAICSPLGFLTPLFFTIEPENFIFILAFLAGILLHVSTTILFEITENHRFNLIKFIAVVFGVVLAFFQH